MNQGVVAIVMGLAVALTAGCTQQPEERVTSTTSAPSPTGDATDATYGDVQELVTAVEQAGALCKKWQTPARDRLAFESRYCDKSSVEDVSIYADHERMLKAIRESRQFAKLWWEEAGWKTSQSILVGPNWTVTGDVTLMEQLQEALGGELHDNTDVYR